MTSSSHSDILVIGGGVAGLAAAAALARRGRKVTVLEARDRWGGRIFTARPRGWRTPVELGAEFVHGGNPALWQALSRHHIGSRNVPTRHWRFDGHTIGPIDDVTDQIERVTKHIQPRKMAGWSFAEFMRRCGSQFTAEDRELALGFIEGFEAAPTARMSASAVAGESLDTSEQYHVPRGYDQLVAGLVREARHAKVALVLRSPVSEIRWQRGDVTVTAAGRKFTARAVVLAIPLGVLQARRGQRGAIAFVPPMRAKTKMLARLQMGHVIRLTLRIDPAGWASVVPPELRRVRGGFGFIHSRVEGVPVWWALSGRRVLTGWAGGPIALALASRSRCGIFEKALSSLSRVLGVKKIALRRAVMDFATHNWSRDPYSRGAYSFAVAGAETAAEKFREPVQETLFFAGEATADGAEIGTVHGALASGLRAAKEAIEISIR